MSNTDADISRFITARALIGQGGKKGEVSLQDNGKVRMTLAAYAQIAEELHDAKDRLAEVRAVFDE
jgi:hypothetical protein